MAEDRFIVKRFNNGPKVRAENMPVGHDMPTIEVFDTHSGRDNPVAFIAPAFIHEMLALLNARPIDPYRDRAEDVGNSSDKVCDECGETYPENAEGEEGDFHKESCSLHLPSPFDVSYEVFPADSKYPQGRCHIYPNSKKGGQWIYQNVTTNVSDTLYFNLAGGRKHLSVMRDAGLIVVEKRPT